MQWYNGARGGACWCNGASVIVLESYYESVSHIGPNLLMIVLTFTVAIN